MGFPRGVNADTDVSVAASAVDGVVTVAVAGELAVPWAQAAYGRLVAIVDEHLTSVVALDLAGVQFCDAAGLRALLELRGHVLAAGGRLHVIAVSEPMEWLFTVTGTAPLFDGRLVPSRAGPGIAATRLEGVQPNGSGVETPTG
jgi:anti-anti-sigma factor